MNKISGNFKILPQFHITNNMAIGSNNPLISHLGALDYPINGDMIIWDTVRDVIGG